MRSLPQDRYGPDRTAGWPRLLQPRSDPPPARRQFWASQVSSALKPGQLIQPIERCRLIALGQRRVIENSIHEVLYRAFENEHCLADVQQLGSAFPDDVDSEQLLSLAMKDELHAAGGIAANLAACDLAIIRDTDLVRDIFVRELLLRLSDEGNLRDSVDAVRIKSRIRRDRGAESVCRGEAALLHRNRGQ